MGKRSNFPRRHQDDYPTPARAFAPLIPFLDKRALLVEPCPGAGRLVKHMRKAGFEVASRAGDARTQRYRQPGRPWMFVTNPPWTREILHPIIINLSEQAPTWLLFDADWLHLVCAAPLLPRLRQIVSVGRVKWFVGSKSTSLDNSCWYRFGRVDEASPAKFYGRTIPEAACRPRDRCRSGKTSR
jgi:hypothetical protein